MNLRWTFCVPGIPFVGDTLDHQSLGGSETAALCLARQLAARGDSVFVFTSSEVGGVYDGVYYMPITQFRPFATSTPHDVCVVQRSPEQFASSYASRLNVLWQHDLLLGRHRQIMAGSLWNIDKVALLSQYMIDQYGEVMGLEPSVIFHTRNGIDLADFEAHRGLPRDPHKILYTSRPERGLENLLERIMPALWQRDPNYRLHVSAYDNKSAHLDAIYANVQALMARHSDRVVWMGHLKREQLYQEYATSHLLVYPTPSHSIKQFAEISWITGMECQASGLPIVTTDWGAAPETVDPDAGTLIEGRPWDEGYTERFVDAVLGYRDAERWAAASRAGQERAKRLDWADVAAEWHDMAVEEIQARNDSPARLRVHFRSRGSDTDDKARNEPIAKAKPISLEGVCLQMLSELIADVRPARMLDLTPGPHDRTLAEGFPGLEVHHKPDGQPYDLVWSANVIHRAKQPESAIAEMESHARPGGAVAFLTPYGPTDRSDGVDVSGRWELELSDFEDMLTGKSDLDVQSAVTGQSERTREPHGWHRVRYVADHDTGVVPVNMQRKLALQRPRQTVSLNMIVGGERGEQTLEWALKSVCPYMDEVLIGDCGMSARAAEIARRYGDVIACPNPLKEGFDTARNALLDHASTDWVFWMDSDERLIGGHALAKYLRHNTFAGYSIRQHHLAIDAEFSPDMPVRLFRRDGFNGRHMYFYGRIHEHPELTMNEGPGPVVIIGDVHIAHVGYLDEGVRRSRFDRNTPLMEMDLRDHPDRLLLKHFIMRDNMLMVAHELQSNGGRLQDWMLERARETVSIYREHFMGKPKYANVDGLSYYDQAMQVLGEGIEVQAAIGAKRDGIGDDQPSEFRGRFADADEAKIELTSRLEQKVKPLEGSIF
jgi:glycosyltransferase involved in cell wall biosynthesis